jgi:hypothetical protein
MSNGADGLMLNGVHLLKRVVQNSWGIDCLKSQHFVIEMPNEERFGCECVWLDIDIGPRDVLEEAGLAHVGVSANDQCPGIGIDRGQTAQMLPDLLEIYKRVLQSLADCCHSSQSRTLELLALEQALTILDEAHVIARNRLN